MEGTPRFLELKDRFGNPLLFSHAGDVYLGPSPLIPDGRQRLAEVKVMELREDDVIIAGFMKSGERHRLTPPEDTAGGVVGGGAGVGGGGGGGNP